MIAGDLDLGLRRSGLGLDGGAGAVDQSESTVNTLSCGERRKEEIVSDDPHYRAHESRPYDNL